MTTIQDPNVHWISLKDLKRIKRCQGCHQPMTVKQVNLTEACRACFNEKCDPSFTNTPNIEYIHRAYRDMELDKKEKGSPSFPVSLEEEVDKVNKLFSEVESMVGHRLPKEYWNEIKIPSSSKKQHEDLKDSKITQEPIHDKYDQQYSSKDNFSDKLKTESTSVVLVNPQFEVNGLRIEVGIPGVPLFEEQPAQSCWTNPPVNTNVTHLEEQPVQSCWTFPPVNTNVTYLEQHVPPVNTDVTHLEEQPAQSCWTGPPVNTNVTHLEEQPVQSCRTFPPVNTNVTYLEQHVPPVNTDVTHLEEQPVQSCWTGPPVNTNVTYLEQHVRPVNTDVTRLEEQPVQSCWTSPPVNTNVTYLEEQPAQPCWTSPPVNTNASHLGEQPVQLCWTVPPNATHQEEVQDCNGGLEYSHLTTVNEQYQYPVLPMNDFDVAPNEVEHPTYVTRSVTLPVAAETDEGDFSAGYDEIPVPSTSGENFLYGVQSQSSSLNITDSQDNVCFPNNEVSASEEYFNCTQTNGISENSSLHCETNIESTSSDTIEDKTFQSDLMKVQDDIKDEETFEKGNGVNDSIAAVNEDFELNFKITNNIRCYRPRKGPKLIPKIKSENGFSRVSNNSKLRASQSNLSNQTHNKQNTFDICKEVDATYSSSVLFQNSAVPLVQPFDQNLVVLPEQNYGSCVSSTKVFTNCTNMSMSSDSQPNFLDLDQSDNKQSTVELCKDVIPVSSVKPFDQIPNVQPEHDNILCVNRATLSSKGTKISGPIKNEGSGILIEEVAVVKKRGGGSTLITKPTKGRKKGSPKLERKKGSLNLGRKTESPNLGRKKGSPNPESAKAGSCSKVKSVTKLNTSPNSSLTGADATKVISKGFGFNELKNFGGAKSSAEVKPKVSKPPPETKPKVSKQSPRKKKTNFNKGSNDAHSKNNEINDCIEKAIADMQQSTVSPTVDTLELHLEEMFSEILK